MTPRCQYVQRHHQGPHRCVAGACGDTEATVSDDPITAGGFIGLCGIDSGAADAGATASNVELTLVHVESNKVIASYTFATIAACA